MEGKMWAWKCIILGLLVLANQYYLMWNWGTFLGLVLILKGIVMMTCCQSSCDMPAAKKKRR